MTGTEVRRISPMRAFSLIHLPTRSSRAAPEHARILGRLLVASSSISKNSTAKTIRGKYGRF